MRWPVPICKKFGGCSKCALQVCHTISSLGRCIATTFHALKYLRALYVELLLLLCFLLCLFFLTDLCLKYENLLHACAAAKMLPSTGDMKIKWSKILLILNYNYIVCLVGQQWHNGMKRTAVRKPGNAQKARPFRLVARKTVWSSSLEVPSANRGPILWRMQILNKDTPPERLALAGSSTRGFVKPSILIPATHLNVVAPLRGRPEPRLNAP